MNIFRRMTRWIDGFMSRHPYQTNEEETKKVLELQERYKSLAKTNPYKEKVDEKNVEE